MQLTVINSFQRQRVLLTLTEVTHGVIDSIRPFIGKVLWERGINAIQHTSLHFNDQSVRVRTHCAVYEKSQSVHLLYRIQTGAGLSSSNVREYIKRRQYHPITIIVFYIQSISLSSAVVLS